MTSIAFSKMFKLIIFRGQRAKALLQNNLLPIGICLSLTGFVTFLMYYRQGVERETFANVYYLKFIQEFPRSIGYQTEPVFIALASFLTKELHLPVVWAITILKLVIYFADLLIFWAIVYRLTKSHLMAMTGVVALGLSYSLISLTDNLLRNHLGLMILLLIIYFILLIFNEKVKNSYLYVLITGMLIGILAYTHVQPLLVIAVTLTSFFGLLVVKLFIQILLKKWRNVDILKKYIKINVSILVIGFIVGFPYFSHLVYRIIQTFIGIGDYVGKDPLFSDSATTTSNTSLSSFSSQGLGLMTLIQSFRFLFEYRDVSLSLFAIGVIFFGIIYLLWCKRNLFTVFLITLWAVIYVGTKLDFFGIYIISYRFMLTLIVPSLLIFILILNTFFERIKIKRFVVLATIAVLAGFLAHNMPAVLEITFLRDFKTAQNQRQELQKLLSSYQFVPSDTIANSGTEIDGVLIQSKILSANELFSLETSQEAYDYAKRMGIDYIIFDEARKERIGNDLGIIYQFEFESFKDERYFEKMFEKRIDFSHILM